MINLNKILNELSEEKIDQLVDVDLRAGKKKKKNKKNKEKSAKSSESSISSISSCSKSTTSQNFFEEECVIMN
ncbi:MAG: hypothetical protein HKN92_10525 [Chitinophagales bacterium]|nr:hypothetical protein [Chitinophagales bacterium]